MVLPFVAGFDRGEDGNLVALGSIIKAADNEWIIDVEPREQGGIVVTFGIDNYGSENPDERRQPREFVWDGGRFVQVGGPASFPPTP